MQITYTLTIDQDRSKILTALTSAAGQDPRLVMYLTSRGLNEPFLALLKEMADRVHELQWCEDPECDEKKV